MYKLLVLTIVFGVVSAGSLQKRNVVFSEYPSYELVVPQPISVIVDLVSTIIGYKMSALSLAVTAIKWVVSNSLVIILGGISAFGFCKMTSICAINYEQYIPISQLRGLATAENIDTAEKFLLTAVEKYAEEQTYSY